MFSLWLRAGYLPMGVWGGHDDALFLRLARNLGQGQWLGPYDQLTLAKGAFFPVFLLLGKASGLPLKLVEHLLYVLTAMLAATTVLRLTGMRWLAAMVALVLVFSPVPWMFEGGSRVTREPIYQVMTLAILLISVRYFLLDNTRPAVGLVLGVLGGCYWLTREEGVWLLPSLAILLLPCVLRLGRKCILQVMAGVGGRPAADGIPARRIPRAGDECQCGQLVPLRYFSKQRFSLWPVRRCLRFAGAHRA
ncbi:MAG: hypothetical protein IPF74_00550 [Rhodocyclaceae bacterium]|nr:hypothetical protein [Rhodocyclaceae bacterium]